MDFARVLEIARPYLGEVVGVHGDWTPLDDREWLRRRLGIEEPDGLLSHGRAQRLIYLRRYAAKLSYELELHAAPDGRSPKATHRAPRFRDIFRS